MEDVDARVRGRSRRSTRRLCFLQCTAAYPAAPEELEPQRHRHAARAFPELVIGLSDHDNGIAMAVAAYVLGARIIEKHFTLNHTWKGTDHAFSLEPVGMRKLVRDLRARPRGAGRRRQASAAGRARRRCVKMGKKLVARRAARRGHVLGDGRRRDEVAGRRAAAVHPRRRCSGRTLHPAASSRTTPITLRGARAGRGRVTPSARRAASPSSPARSAGSGPVWCEALLEAGATVVALDLDRRRRPRRRSRVSQRSRPAAGCATMPADVRDRASLEAARDRCEAEVARRPSWSTMPASISRRARPTTYAIEDVPARARSRGVLDVNVTGRVPGGQVFGPAMVRAGPRLDRQHRLALRIGLARRPVLRSPSGRSAVPQAAGLRRVQGGAGQPHPLSRHPLGPHGVRVNALSPGGVEGGQDPEFKRKFTTGCRWAAWPRPGPRRPAYIPRLRRLVLRHRDRAPGGRRLHRLVAPGTTT